MSKESIGLGISISARDKPCPNNVPTQLHSVSVQYAMPNAYLWRRQRWNSRSRRRRRIVLFAIVLVVVNVLLLFRNRRLHRLVRIVLTVIDCCCGSCCCCSVVAVIGNFVLARSLRHRHLPVRHHPGTNVLFVAQGFCFWISFSFLSPCLVLSCLVCHTACTISIRLF